MHTEKLEEMIDFCEELLNILETDTEYDQLTDEQMTNISNSYDLLKSAHDSIFFNVDEERDREIERIFENFTSEDFLIDFEEDEIFESKKLDPVGKEDADIDNDGDVDDSDEYLHRRRKAIRKAIKNTRK